MLKGSPYTTFPPHDDIKFFWLQGLFKQYFCPRTTSEICNLCSWRSNLSVLLPENLCAYFELSAQAWILYKAPQWNARYPNSCPERIKLKMHWGCGPRPLFAGLIQRRWTPWSKPKHGLTIITIKANTQYHFIMNNFQIIRQQLNRLLNALQTY